MGNESREAEAQGKSALVDWRGQKFEVEREYGEWSVDFVESLEEGKSVGIVRGALGPSQWRTIKAMNLKMRDLDELAEAVAAALGFGSVGESQTSSD